MMAALTAIALLAPLVGAARATGNQDVALSRNVDTALADPSPSPTAIPMETATEQGLREAPNAAETTAAPLTIATLTPTQGVETPDLPTTTALASCTVPESDALVAPDLAQPAWFRDDFEDQRPEWRSLAGTWVVADGAFVQSDPNGYDLISELALPLPAEVSISVTMTPLGQTFGGGIMIGQPVPMLRNGATIIDFTDDGRFLRWGSYTEDTGAYQYRGGVSMGADFDPLTSHTLTVLATADRTTVLVDGVTVGIFDPVPSGQAGVMTSASAMTFDNLVVADELDPTVVGEASNVDA